MRMPDPKPGWVEGRVRESADGLSKREQPSPAAEQQRLREAAEREAKARTEREGGRERH
jgi:hypothetical protein